MIKAWKSFSIFAILVLLMLFVPAAMLGDFTVTGGATYNLTISSTAGGSVTTPGEGPFGPYANGMVVDLVATPDSGYHFVNWAGDVDTIADVNSASTNITMLGNYSITANFAPTVTEINEIMFDPIGEDAGMEWIELYNNGTGAENINGSTISNRTGEVAATLPNWSFPNQTYLLVCFGNGTNDANFSDGAGSFYTGINLETFNNTEDEVALYDGSPNSSTIRDFVSWCADGNYNPGPAHDYAVSAGIWTSGEFVDVSFTTGTNFVLDGESIGRNKYSSDTNSPTDWDDHGGADVYGPTPGAKNAVTYGHVMRNLPDVTYPGQTFDVYVNFTAPVDGFNSIGLIDLAPDGWEVAVDTTWCTPNADAVLATDNKAEIAWFGEPGVGFDNGTPFTAVYKVTVPDDAELGINEFPLDDCSKAWLGYYVGPLGPYASCVIGEHEMTVTTTIDVMRDLPADALDFDAEYPGDTFDVYVNFTAPVDDFNSIGLTDYAPAGWEVETNKTWCDPVADWTMHPYNKAEYAWDGPFGEGQNFTARYKVTIPATAIPGSSYWPDCTPLPYPPWEGSPINNYAVWLEYWFGADGPYESCITGEREKIVTVPGCVVGETRDVNGDMLMIPLDTVTVDLWEDLPTDVWEDQDSSTIVGNVTQYQNCANDTGMYYQTASHYCYYPVNSSAMPGTRNPNYPLLINWSTPELLAAGFTMDFVGDYGLVCKAATMSYAMESVNHWLYTPVDKYGTPQPDWQLSSWKVSQVVHSWQFPCGCRCSGDKPIW